jgi:hypothetical protein
VLILSREIVFHNTIRNLPHNKTNLIEISLFKIKIYYFFILSQMPKDLILDYMHIRLNDIYRGEEKMFPKVIDLNKGISFYKCPDRCNANPC